MFAIVYYKLRVPGKPLKVRSTEQFVLYISIRFLNNMHLRLSNRCIKINLFSPFDDSS